MDKAPKPHKVPARRSTWLRRIGLVLAGIVLIGAGWLAYLLSSGPVHVPLLAGFMSEKASNGPARLTIADTLIDVTGGDGIRVIVREALLTVAGEVPVEVSLPLVEAPVEFGALLSGNIQFSSLTIDRPLVTLGVREGGEPNLPKMNLMMEAVNRVSDVVEGAFSRRKLERVSVQNGTVAVQGAIVRNFSGIDAEITWDQERTIHARANVAGRVEPWTIEFLRKAPLDGKDRSIAIVVDGISVADLVNPVKVPKAGKDLGIPLQMKFETGLSGDGVFLYANFVGRVAEGVFHIGPTPIHFDDAALSLVWRGDDPKIKVTRSHAINGNTQIFFTGEIVPPTEASSDWTVELSTDLARFGSSDVPLPPFIVNDMSLSARFEPASRTLFLDNILIAAGKARAYMVGSVEMRDDGPYLALAIDGERVPIGLAKHLWPITVVPPARQWVINRIKSGMIDEARADISLRPSAFDPNDPDPGWSGDDMKVSLTFSNARVAPVGEVPDAYDLSGTLNVSNETMTVHAGGGLIYTGSGAQVSVPNVTFQIQRLREKVNKLGVLDLEMEGGVREIGRIFDSRPFRVLAKTGLTPGAIAGDGRSWVHAEFPVRKDIDLATVQWNAKAESGNFSLNKPVRGHTIKDAEINLRADRRQVAITGKGVLDGLPADIDLLFPLGDSGVEGRQGVVLNVTAKQLKKNGIDLTALLDGPMTLIVDDANGGQTFNVDLTKTVVRLDALGWTKAAGVPATAEFLVKTDDEGYHVQDFVLRSDGVDVNGSMTLSKAGDLETASFATFQLRAGDETSVSVQRTKAGRYKVAMIGNSFDARGLIREVRKPSTGSAGQGGSDLIKGLSVTASLSRVTGFNGVRLNDFVGLIEANATGVTKADLSGSLEGRSPFKFSLQAAGTGKVADGDFGDAGATLKFLDLYERMRGGHGKLRVNMYDTKTWDGSFRVRELSITQDPALKRLSSDPSLLRSQLRNDGGFRLPASAQNGESSFQTLDILFTRAGDLLTIHKGGLKGAVFGGTVSGTVNLASQTIDLTGTFVPIFALNNIFSKIPILGFALGGGSGEGLIGVTYRVTGELSDPKLSVNPISAIAPGIFRKMFQ
jgi:hypothetical protein